MTAAAQALRILIIAAAAFTFAACSYGTRIADRSVAGPLNAIAITPVRPHEIAVLAGETEEKSVSVFFDTPGGAEQARFSVSKYASTISAQRTRGGFLLALAPPRGPGAIEQWTADGDLKRTIYTSRPVLSLTDEMDGVVYGLTGAAPHGRAALPVRLSDGRVSEPIRVPDRTYALATCRLAGRPVLLAVERGDIVTIVPLDTGEWIGTAMRARVIACLPQRQSIVGIQTGAFTRFVVFLELHRESQRLRSIVAPPDATDLAVASDGTIFVLRLTGNESRIDVWHPSETAMVAAR